MSEIIDTHLENFGYAMIFVVGKQDKESLGEPSTIIQENFLQSIPEGASTSLTKGNEATYRFFPKLGVYVGYMDKKGINKTKDIAASLHPAENISPIRPVAKRLAMSAGSMTWGCQRLGLDKIWSQGLTGKGVRVGHLDTGVDAKHEALRGKIKGFIDTDPNTGDIIPDPRSPEDAAYDSDEHGTHTAGTICGGLANGMAIGVAPNCDLFSGLVIEGGKVEFRVLRGMEWCIENHVRILSMSLGLRGYTPVWLEIVRRLRQNGVLPVFAIGNEGPGTSRSPGNYVEPISVGAMDSNDHVADFSSSVKFDRQEEPYEPEVVAPGVNVISAKPGGGVQAMDGTSMATPHAAGVAAILFQFQPTATLEQIEKALQDTCRPLTGESKIRYGYGSIDVQAAMAALKKMM
ncbi:MAG TPA: S8 family serine peptidase [Nitrososphaeraceae archaeon]|jgi:subtilisin|nr:S8 family serine peptidase [Nitrososphaeraceae archaeon]